MEKQTWIWNLKMIWLYTLDKMKELGEPRLSSLLGTITGDAAKYIHNLQIFKFQLKLKLLTKLEMCVLKKGEYHQQQEENEVLVLLDSAISFRLE